MLSNPNRRAFSHGSSPSAIETVRAMRFHAKGELSIQNKPISVCSSVRALGVVTPSPPSNLISLKSAAYFLLPTRYGGLERNCELRLSTNGVTSPQPGAKAKLTPGGKRYSP